MRISLRLLSTLARNPTFQLDERYFISIFFCTISGGGLSCAVGGKERVMFLISGEIWAQTFFVKMGNMMNHIIAWWQSSVHRWKRAIKAGWKRDTVKHTYGLCLCYDSSNIKSSSTHIVKDTRVREWKLKFSSFLRHLMKKKVKSAACEWKLNFTLESSYRALAAAADSLC